MNSVVSQPNFMGEYEHTLDNKGRLIIPAKYRPHLGGTFYLVNGWDKECIFLFPPAEWNKIVEKYLSNLTLIDREGQNFVRRLASGAAECEMDRQGRIFIPPNLREYAKIDTKVTVVGVIHRIEIWATERWQKEKEKEFIQLAKEMESRFSF